jgi:copper resistance protein B
MSARANFHRKTARPKPVLYVFISAIIGIMPFLNATALQAQSAGSEAPGKVIPTVPGSEAPVMSDRIFKHALLDQFEDRTNGPDNELRWDGEAWVGTDMNRIWLKSEGFASTSGVSDGDQELLYDHPIPRMKYFDAQIGVRADLDSGPTRTWAAIGVEGLAPYYFEFAPTLYIRNDGHVAGRITGSYDMLLTQRWIVQPEAELNLYSKDDPTRGIGSGFSELDTGVRLRYEISRKFAPYVGFAYDGKYGDTASYARRAGESTSDPRFVFGLRLWY